MSILTPPPVFSLPSRFSIAPVANTQSGGRSPFDGTEQTLRQPGERWAARMAWEGLTQAEWRPLIAFLAALGGRAGRFRWSPAAVMPRRASGLPGTGVVVDGTWTGTALPLRGWAANAQCFLAGDLMGFTDPTGRDRLHMVTANIIAGADGRCIALISPAIRRAPADGAAVAIALPTAIWGLAADRNALDLQRGLIAGGSLDFEEKLI